MINVLKKNSIIEDEETKRENEVLNIVDTAFKI